MNHTIFLIKPMFYASNTPQNDTGNLPFEPYVVLHWLPPTANLIRAVGRMETEFQEGLLPMISMSHLPNMVIRMCAYSHYSG